MPRQRKTKEPTTTEAALEAASASLDDDDGSAAVDLGGASAAETSSSDQSPELPGEVDAIEDDEVAIDAPPAEALPALIEALLFVSDGPVEARTLARGLGVSQRAIARALDELSASLAGRGLMLQTGRDGAQLVTVPSAAPYVQTFLGLEQNRRLSNAALEALAIVAYRQPVTRATVEAVRGVSSEGAIQTLRARGLIEEAGRAQGPGRPTLFVTTRRFLEHFGLQGPQDLPPLGDYEMPPRDAPDPLPAGDEVEPSTTGQTDDQLDVRAEEDSADDSPAGDTVEDVAGALASLSQAARALADPERSRAGATPLLLLTAGRLETALPEEPPASPALLPAADFVPALPHD